MTTATQVARRTWTDVARRSDTVVLVLFGALAVGAAALYLWKGRGLVFYYDEWGFIMNRREWTADAFLQPHNEHLSALPVAIYKLLFAVVGLDAYWPYRLAVVAAHALVAGLVFVLARRAAGNLVGLAAAALILFLGSGWENILWPFQVGYLVSLAAGLAAIVLLDREDLLGDVLAALALVVSLASASIGVPMAVAVLVLVAFGPRRRRRAWVVLAPLALYALWWIAYGRTHPEVGGSVQSNIPNLPTYVADSIAGALAGLTGLTAEWGRPLALVAVIALVYVLLRARPFPHRATAFLAAGTAFWALGALTRGALNVPAGSRYVYFGSVIAVLAAAELLRGVRLGRAGSVLLVLAVVAAGLGNYRYLEGGVAHLAEYTGYVGSSLGALEQAAPDVDPDYGPAPTHAPDVRAGPYLETVEDLGSPAFTPAEILRQAEHHRQAADAVLRAALGIATRAGGEAGGAAPDVESSDGAVVRPSGACVDIDATEGNATAELAVAGGGVFLRPAEGAFVEVAVRRFGSEYDPNAGMTLPQGPSTILLPRLGLDIPWHVRVATTGPVAACGAADG